MKVYTYTDENKGDFDASGNSSRYFTSLRKARASVRATIPSGEAAVIYAQDIGNISASLVLTLLNGDAFVVKATIVATEIGKAEARDGE